jgi:hypothetical protein
MVALLQRLPAEASAAGGAVLLARGNHEVMPLMAADGAPEWLQTWLDYGGRATLAAYGCGDAGAVAATRLREEMERCAPRLFDWLHSLPQAVRWRDVLFVHGGLAAGYGPDDLGVTTEEHLWVRAGFFAAPWDADGYAAYEAAGIGRVVFGHTPQWHGHATYHEGRSLAIDTNAVGVPHMPPGAEQQLTLVGFDGSGSGSFADARVITVPTADAPERAGA